ncbi:MAG: Holliday junction DNA helicase RuvA [Candidatus Margulisbacteria bacterium GWF2_35_9]|nr:MAG: Holliday junction DNA helicase RuvA [Candidatus Margulisbacteria bacterium GWF2_35_9]
MYSFFKGNLCDLFENSMTIDVNGIGYHLHISKKDSQYYTPSIKQDIKVYVHLNVKEDSHTLYGFSTSNLKDIFLILISISGIGPKIALTILSELETDQLISSILTNNIIPLTAVSGIGKKTAERMVLELKDKFKNITVDINLDSAIKESSLKQQVQTEARSALASLGYNQPEIRRMFQSIAGETDETSTVEEIITMALRSKSSI